ncbi:MAG: PAS domain S-box protein, partial [Calditrichaceae bacterium]|nr:PAS domain S-box protein [Calditrichaceae bacterium]
MKSKKINNNDCLDNLNSLHNEIKRLSSKLEEQQTLLNQYKSLLFKFELLCEKTDRAYCICDSNGSILLINQNAANFFGFTPSELLNQNLIDINNRTELFTASGKR